MNEAQPRSQTIHGGGTLWGTLFVTALVVMLTGCGESSVRPTTLEGAWLGDGAFHTSAGDAEAQAQLELLSDGSYRFLILKPNILALTGAERGTWSRTGQTLILTPAAPPPAAATGGTPNVSGSVFEQLRRGGPAKPPRSLVIADDLRDLRFNDGKLDLILTPNLDATAKLRATGDVTGQ